MYIFRLLNCNIDIINTQIYSDYQNIYSLCLQSITYFINHPRHFVCFIYFGIFVNVFRLLIFLLNKVNESPFIMSLKVGRFLS